MEIEEIIDVLHVCADDEIICTACPYYDTGVYGSGTAACYQNLMLEAADAIESQQKRIAELEAALREQEERDNRIESDAVKNDPLTLDELRKMDGEPVWVETGEVSLGEQIIGSWEIFICHESAIYYFTRRKRGFFAEHYGKTWLAYRSKPKE